MARTSAPDSATSQFYFNLVDNSSLNARNGADGYAVFGRVLEGLDVMDAIAASPTESRNGQADVPVEDVLLERAERIQRASMEG
jgi:cyclophilin family peptidyl-prolyl cis-trans isomerase